MSAAVAVAASVLVFAWLRWGSGQTVGAQAREARQGSSALECYEHAQKQTRLADGPAFLLCRGANSNAPARCYESGRTETELTNRQLFDLCRCAESTEPVRCFERASRETFLLDERIIQLCSPIVAENLRLNCTPIH